MKNPLYTKCLKISEIRILQQKKKIKNDVRVSHIYFLRMVVSGITVPSLICMIEASLPALRINISPVNW